MTTEQLKLIIDLLNNAGENAQLIALWWLIVPVVKMIVGFTGGGLIAVYVVKKVTNAIAMNTDTMDAWRQVCNKVGLPQAGVSYSSDVDAVLRRINPDTKK